MNRFRILLGGLSLILALPTFSDGASPGKQWEQVVAAAKKEGKLVLYAAGSGISKQHLITFKNRFETAFPGIQVSYLGGRSSEMFSRQRIAAMSAAILCLHSKSLPALKENPSTGRRGVPLSVVLPPESRRRSPRQPD